MAEYSIDIAAIKADLSGTENPVQQSVSAINVLYARQDAPVENTSSTFKYADELGFPYISSSDMPSGSKWLVYYQANLGSANDAAGSGMVKGTFCNTHASPSRGTTLLATGWYKCTGHGNPVMMNGGQVAGFLEYTSNGTDDLEWTFSSTAGSRVQLGGMQTIAIQTDGTNALTKDQDGGDYWHEEQVNALGKTNTSFEEVFSTTYTPATSGDFWLFVSSEISGISFQSLASVRVMVDGQQILGQWIREFRESREIATFVMSHRVALSGGVEHTITLEGRSAGGTPYVLYTRTRITIINLSVFGANSFTTEYLPSYITTDYPGWEPLVEIGNFDPVTDGEYVLAVGSAMVFRQVGAASMLRVVNENTGAPLNDFAANSEYFTASPDANVIISGGIEMIGAPNTYRLYGAGEAGYDSYQPQGYPNWPASLMLLSLTRVTSPTSVTVSGGEYMDISLYKEIPGGDLDAPANADQSVTTTAIGNLSYVPPSGIVPAHPRLWVTPERRAYWAANVGGSDWNNMQADSHWGDYGFHYALKWLANGSSSDKALAIADIQNRYNNGGPMLNSYANPSSSWQGLRQSMRNWSLCYDWLYNEPEFTPTLKKFLEDLMCAAVYMLYHADRDATALIIYNNGGSNPSTGVAPYRTTTLQNFCSTYHYVAMMAGAALYPTPATFKWPPVTGQTINFELDYDYAGNKTRPDGSNPTYTEIMDWCRDRINDFIYPEWDEKWAGGWNEGIPYGTGCGRYQLETLAAIKHWNNEYTSGHSFLDNTTKYYTYSFMPRRELVTVPRGENGGDDGRWLQRENYFRHAYLMHSYLYNDPYSQYWLESGPLQQMDTGDVHEEVPFDFLAGNRNNAGEDYKLSWPTSYITPGGDRLFVSRSDWTDSAVHVSMCSGIHKRAHDHSDKGSVNIWKSVTPSGDSSGGFLVCDSQYFAKNLGDRVTSQYHNNWTMFEYAPLTDGSVEMRTDGWSMLQRVNPNRDDPEIDFSYSDDVYAYARANLGSSFATTKTHVAPYNAETVKSPIDDICQREVLHIKNGSYVVIYDRMRVVSPFIRSDTDFQARWHWGGQPTNVGGGVYRMDNAHGARAYQKIFNADAMSFEDMALTYPCYRQKVSHYMGTGAAWDLTVFEIPDTPSKANMTNTEVGPSGSIFLPGSMNTVTIKESSYINVAFSSEEDGSTPTTINYYVPKLGDSDQHYVCNLTPDQAYLITETDLGSGYFWYSLAETLDSNFVATSGGVVSFQPSEIDTQLSTPIRGSDTSIAFSHSGYVQEGSLSDGSDTSVAFYELGSLSYDGGGGSEFVSGYDYSLAFTETGDFPGDIFSDEVLGTSSRGRVLYTPPDPPPPRYSEKKIFRGNVAFYPNEDLGSVFFANEPTFDSESIILSDEDDNTFVRTYRQSDPPIPGVNKIPLSKISLGLDDPSGFNGRITSIKFVVRIRTAVVSGNLNPVLVCYLRNNSNVVLVQHNIELNDILYDVQEVESPVIPVSITTDEMRGCSIELRPRAEAYSPSYYLEISAVWVETAGKQSEKVIR